VFELDLVLLAYLEEAWVEVAMSGLVVDSLEKDRQPRLPSAVTSGGRVDVSTSTSVLEDLLRGQFVGVCLALSDSVTTLSLGKSEYLLEGPPRAAMDFVAACTVDSSSQIRVGTSDGWFVSYSP